MSKNRMVGMAFQTIAAYMTKLEDSPEDWHLSPIRGHSRVHKLFPFYPADLATLETLRITTVSQIFETHLSGRIDKSTSPELLASLAPYPALQHKLRIFTRAFLQQPFHNKYSCPRTHLTSIVNLDTNLSRRYKLKCRELLDSAIEVAPAYRTRIRDNIAIRPTQRVFNNAYGALRLPVITSKTRETAFQILNRTVWTNNKAHKSRMRLDPNCDRCGKTETMEHLLCECENYSEPLWGKLAEALTRLFRNISQHDAPRVDLGQTNIIFNIPHPSLLLHVRDKESRNALLLLVQEIKRDIIYRRMNLPPSANRIIDPMRLTAHLCSTVRRLHSYLQYIGFVKYTKASETLQRLQDLLVA
jgi:hypothetical protein